MAPSYVVLGSSTWPALIGGAERSTLELARELSLDGEVTLLAPAPLGGYEFDSWADDGRTWRTVRLTPNMFGFAQMEKTGLERFGSKIRHLVELFLGPRFLIQDCGRDLLAPIRQADVVVTSSLSGLGSRIWLTAGRASVVHITRDYYLTCPRTTRFRAGAICTKTCTDCRPFETLNRSRSARVDHVIHISDFLAGLHEDRGFFPNAQSHIVPNMPTSSAAGDDLGDGQPSHGAPVTVGFLGSSLDYKGLDFLLGVLDRPELAGQLRLLVAGATPGGRAVQHLDAVWLGTVPAFDLLKQVDVLAVPSLWAEPQGRVLAEAGLAGVPVVTTGFGGLAEGLGRDASGWSLGADVGKWRAFMNSLAVEGRGRLARCDVVRDGQPTSRRSQAEVIVSIAASRGRNIEDQVQSADPGREGRGVGTQP